MNLILVLNLRFSRRRNISRDFLGFCALEFGG
jgi:hypothetical protein